MDETMVLKILGIIIIIYLLKWIITSFSDAISSLDSKVRQRLAILLILLTGVITLAYMFRNPIEERIKNYASSQRSQKMITIADNIVTLADDAEAFSKSNSHDKAIEMYHKAIRLIKQHRKSIEELYIPLGKVAFSIAQSNLSEEVKNTLLVEDLKLIESPFQRASDTIRMKNKGEEEEKQKQALYDQFLTSNLPVESKVIGAISCIEAFCDMRKPLSDYDRITTWSCFFSFVNTFASSGLSAETKLMFFQTTIPLVENKFKLGYSTIWDFFDIASSTFSSEEVMKNLYQVLKNYQIPTPNYFNSEAEAIERFGGDDGIYLYFLSTLDLTDSDELRKLLTYYYFYDSELLSTRFSKYENYHPKENLQAPYIRGKIIIRTGRSVPSSDYIISGSPYSSASREGRLGHYINSTLEELRAKNSNEMGTIVSIEDDGKRQVGKYESGALAYKACNKVAIIDISLAVIIHREIICGSSPPETAYYTDYRSHKESGVTGKKPVQEITDFIENLPKKDLPDKKYKDGKPLRMESPKVEETVSKTPENTTELSTQEVYLRYPIRFYAHPEDAYPSIDVKKGQKLIILSEQEEWYKVETENHVIGWIRKRILTGISSPNID